MLIVSVRFAIWVVPDVSCAICTRPLTASKSPCDTSHSTCDVASGRWLGTLSQTYTRSSPLKKILGGIQLGGHRGCCRHFSLCSCSACCLNSGNRRTLPCGEPLK